MKDTKLPKPIRNIEGYLIRPINGGMKWGIYAGKKLRYTADSMGDAEKWCEIAKDISERKRQLAQTEKFNKTQKATDKKYTGNMIKRLAERERQLQDFGKAKVKA